MVTTKLSHAAQDYLKALYLLGEGGKPVATAAVAQRMQVSAPSATNMLKRLHEMGLARHTPYRGATLTEAGRKAALEVVRRHRLLESYLTQVLGVPWDEVHAEAEVLEHALSEDLENRIAALLGHPRKDPHGHPIPDKEGKMPKGQEQCLWDAPDGKRVRVEGVSDQRPEALRYLAELGIRPGAILEILRRGPIGGPLFVRVEEQPLHEAALSKELAEAIVVVGVRSR